MKTTTSNVKQVISALQKARFHFSNEDDLQEGIERVLTSNGLIFKREQTLGRAGIIDFLVFGGIGIEVKVDGSPVLVARQLLRYAECDEVEALVLVTAKARLGKLPSLLRGKPVTVITLWEGML